jgi:hypothetical protein
MFKQIIVAMVGAIAAQVTAATLDFSPADRHDHFEPQAASRSAVVTGAPQDFFAMPGTIASIAPFIGPTQIANR